MLSRERERERERERRVKARREVTAYARVLQTIGETSDITHVDIGNCVKTRATNLIATTMDRFRSAHFPIRSNFPRARGQQMMLDDDDDRIFLIYVRGRNTYKKSFSLGF